jgi:hypothetical protein
VKTADQLSIINEAVVFIMIEDLDFAKVQHKIVIGSSKSKIVQRERLWNIMASVVQDDQLIN